MRRLLYILLFIPILVFSQDIDVEGCTDPLAINFDSNANSDNGSCCYESTDTIWNQFGQDIEGEGSFMFGESISLSFDGNIMAVGNPSAEYGSFSGKGEVKVFTFYENSWIQLGQNIRVEEEGGWFGYSVSLSSNGNILAIGAPYSDTNGHRSGCVRVYSFDGESWNQIGQDILGEYEEYFGWSVSLNVDGTSLAIGGPQSDVNDYGDAGVVRVYNFSGDLWSQVGQDINGEWGTSQSGFSVSIDSDGNTIAIGSPYNDGEYVGATGGYNCGSTSVYSYDGGLWNQIGQDIDGEAEGDLSGWSVSLSSDGSALAIGAPYNAGVGAPWNVGLRTGNVRVYKLISNLWVQIGQDIDGLEEEEQIGTNVSIDSSGEILAISGVGDSEGSVVRVYELSGNFWEQIGQNIQSIGEYEYKISLSGNGIKVAIGIPEFNQQQSSINWRGKVVTYVNRTPCNLGCLNPNSFNYNIDSHIDDGSCIDIVNGCLDNDYVEFNQLANTDDGSCEILLSEALDSLSNELEELSAEATTSVSSLQQALDTWNTTIDLSAGWNMFGYGCPSSIDVADGLSNHTASIIITKDNNGNVYMPEFGFNGIGDFTPGFGYQIKLTEPIEGFSLCDWYVNDIPEDNIVSLQESNHILQTENDSLQSELDCYENPEVGDLCYGGIVFYVDETGKHGLVAAVEDLEHIHNTFFFGYGFMWGCNLEDVDGADGVEIGAGYQNTLDIVNHGCVSGSGEEPWGSYTAAQAALEYEVHDYNDWYLPSLDEFFEICYTIGPNGILGNIANLNDTRTYHSSSEIDSLYAWHLGFYSYPCNTPNLTKGSSKRVRPIRSF